MTSSAKSSLSLDEALLIEHLQDSIRSRGEEPQILKANKNFSKHVLNSINHMREDKVLFDVQITVGEKTFDAHKMVLAASSAYFKTMFTSGFKESRQSEIKIEGKGEIFEKLLHFVYSGRLCLCRNTIFDTLAMAVYLQITAAFEPIYEFFSRTGSGTRSLGHLPFEVVLKMALLTENTYKDEWLLQINIQCHTVLGNGLEEFSKTDTFVNDVPADFFEIFLDGDMVVNGYYGHENKVLEAVVRWLKQDWEARKVHSYRLLKKVRLGFVSSEEINTLVDSQIRDIPECKDLVDGVLQILCKKKEEQEAHAAVRQKFDLNDPTERVKFYSEQKKIQTSLPNFSVTYPEMFAVRSTVTSLVSIGGRGNKKSGASYFISDPKDMLNWGWKHFEYFDDLHKQQIHSHATIFVNGILYLAGGTAHKDTDWRKRGPRFCQKSLKHLTSDCEWRELRPMNKARKNFPMIHVDAFIYAIGGEGNKGLLTNVERYNISCNEWEVQAPLLKKCSNMSVIVLEGKLLVYGCCDMRLEDDVKKYIVQVFDPTQNKWYHGSFNENIPSSVSMTPVIVGYNGKCYRVIYQREEKSIHPSKPMVNQLLFNVTDNVVVLGETQSQDLVPNNAGAAFRIESDVFVNAKRYIHKTGITIAEGQTHAVDLGPWRWVNFKCDKDPIGPLLASVTCMTYDSHGELASIRD